VDESAQAAEGTGGDGDKAGDLSAVGGELAVDGVAAGAAGEHVDGGHGRGWRKGLGFARGQSRIVVRGPPFGKGAPGGR
jgi:hypothetical protein